jgi:transcriptional regulator with XRE-family HTH domain
MALHPQIKDRLKEARLGAGFTQQELARRVGVQRASVSQWESGTTVPRTENLARVAKETRKPLAHFMIGVAAKALRAEPNLTVSDALVNQLASLPAPLRLIAERRIAQLSLYAEALPAWLLDTVRVPAEPATFDEWIANVERDAWGLCVCSE